MHKILKLIDWMDDEIRMAEKYAEAAEHCAEEKKTSYVSTYTSMAKQELEHYDKLHRMLLDKIEEHSQDRAVHDAIKQMYEYHHKEQTERVAEVRYMLSEVEKF